MLISRLKNNGKIELWLNKLQQQIRDQIAAKILEGEYKFEELKECAICSSSDFELIGERDRYGLYYPVNICKRCGLLFVNPRLDQSSYNEFYSKEYRKLYLGKDEPTDTFFKQQYAQGERIYNYLQDNALLKETTKSILEIGCGAGGILQYFKEKEFYTEGIDLGEDYLKFGRNNYNLNLHNTGLKNFQPAVKPDVIIYSHVLEHILNLKEELSLIKKISHPQTKIYIEVPSLKQMHKGYDLNILKYFHIAHTYHFTLTSLINLFSKNGFRTVIGNESVKAVFELGDSEKEAICNDYGDAIGYIKKYERIRWLYFISPKAIKYYLGMALIKTLDKLGLKERVKIIFKR